MSVFSQRHRQGPVCPAQTRRAFSLPSPQVRIRPTGVGLSAAPSCYSAAVAVEGSAANREDKMRLPELIRRIQAALTTRGATDELRDLYLDAL